MFEGVVTGNLSRHTDSARVASLDKAVIVARKVAVSRSIVADACIFIQDERKGAAVNKKLV